MSQQSNPPVDPQSRVVFSAPELLAIRQAMQASVTHHLADDEQVWFDGSLIDEHIHAELRLANMARTRVLTMEAAIHVDVKDAKDMVEARVDVVEFLAAMFETWLDESGIYSPNLDWKEFTYQARTVLFRGKLVNDHAESEADRFLREHGLDPDHLYDDDEDALLYDEDSADDDLDDGDDDVSADEDTPSKA